MKELKARKFAPFPKEKEERIRTLEKAHAEVVEKIKASEAEEAQRRNKEERGFVYFSRGNAGADKARELSAEDGRRVADALSGFIEGVNVEVLADAAFEARLREAEGGRMEHAAPPPPVQWTGSSPYGGKERVSGIVAGIEANNALRVTGTLSERIRAAVKKWKSEDTSKARRELASAILAEAGQKRVVLGNGETFELTKNGIDDALIHASKLGGKFLDGAIEVIMNACTFMRDAKQFYRETKNGDTHCNFAGVVTFGNTQYYTAFTCILRPEGLRLKSVNSFKKESGTPPHFQTATQKRARRTTGGAPDIADTLRWLIDNQEKSVEEFNKWISGNKDAKDKKESGRAGGSERRYSRVSSNAKDAEYLEASDFGEDGRVKPEILAEIEAEKAKIREDAQKNGTFGKAPNGAPSNLNAEQWVLVRTKRFKRWFGDWEFARQIEQIFKMSPIHSLTGTEFQKDGVPLTEKVTAFWKEKHNGVAVNPTLGTVRLDREGVKDSLGHGIGSLKSAAYAAVPSVIERGIIFDRQTNWKNRGYDTAVLAAPITIGDKEYICEVVVETRPNRQGFYLHEVELKEKVENAFKTPTKGSAFPTSRLILAKKADKVNEEGVSKVVDENGEPLVVYHGTNERRIEFDSDFLGSATQGVGTQYGFFFSPSLKRAEFYARHSVRGENGGVVEACFLDIKKPTTREPANDGGLSYEEELDDAAGNHYATGIDGVILKNQIDDDTFEPADNYLVFDATQIKSATENAGTYSRGKTDICLLRDFASKVYGWYEPKTKRVVLRAGARMDTALHEILGHATFDWARGNAPELYAKMREYAAGAPEEVKAAIRDAYPDVAEGSAAWEDEVFAHLIAADNEDLIRSRVLGEAGVSWLGKVRAWFGRLWRRFVRALGGSASEDLDVRAIAGMDAKAGMRRLVESALAGKRLGTWSAEARERGNAVSPERERFYSRAAEGTRRARAETRRRAVNTEERRNRERPAFKSATLNVGAYVLGIRTFGIRFFGGAGSMSTSACV